MNNILTILIGLTFVTCINSTTIDGNLLPSPEIITTSASTINNYSLESKKMSNKKETEIVIRNKADYSEKFIQGLKELGYNKFELIDSLLIIDNKDTVKFSQTPKIGEQRVYTARQENLAIALSVERINYTTIDYKIEMVEFGKTEHTENGQADIPPSFFFGAESDANERTGEGYFVTEYADTKANDCYIYIRLGDDNDLGKIIKNCNGKIKDITLENFTTLHRK